MKRSFLLSIITILLFSKINLSQAHDWQSDIVSITKNLTSSSKNLNWKVGDFMQHEIYTLLFFKSSVKEEVIEETESGFWTRTTHKLFDGKIDITGRLYRKSDGKVIKKIENGVEKPVAESGLEYKVIIDEIRDIKVTAGEFKTHYQLLELTEKGSSDTLRMEIWVNKQDSALNGIIKYQIEQGAIAYSELINFCKK